jgi:hypothetical protein
LSKTGQFLVRPVYPLSPSIRSSRRAVLRLNDITKQAFLLYGAMPHKSAGFRTNNKLIFAEKYR